MSPWLKRAERKPLSNPMLWPTMGICWHEFFVRKVLIWLQAFGGWTAFRVCCSMSILFTFSASGFVL